MFVYKTVRYIYIFRSAEKTTFSTKAGDIAVITEMKSVLES